MATLKAKPLEDRVLAVPAVEWTQLSSMETSLVEHYAAGDEDACCALVEEHE